jgi:hypothetical protein
MLAAFARSKSGPYSACLSSLARLGEGVLHDSLVNLPLATLKRLSATLGSFLESLIKPDQEKAALSIIPAALSNHPLEA